MTDRRFEGVSRTHLEAEIRDLETKLAAAARDRDAYLDNLTATQARCTTLLDEQRALQRIVEERGGSKLRGQVMEFHAAFDQPILERPAVPSDERVRLRLRLIAEEFFELLEACNMWEFDIRSMSAKVHDALAPIVDCGDASSVLLPAFADALADLDYVIEGTRLEFGIDGGPIADAVHAANMAKVGGPVVDGKQKKPPGWTPPDVAGELRRQGWEG